MKQIQIDFTKEDSVLHITEDSEVFGVFVGKNNNELKTKLSIVHSKPNLVSRIKIKAVVFDNAKFDMEGILKIEKGASNTDTYLKMDCLIMSDTAYARAVPSLEINESEVKGGHGATIGYIDPETIHYLTSKGLTKKAAEDIIVEAFINS